MNVNEKELTADYPKCASGDTGSPKGIIFSSDKALIDIFDAEYKKVPAGLFGCANRKLIIQRGSC